MEHLQTLKVKQLKNIISTHNASEKANVIKNYSNLKKPELIKAIKTQVKNEHLVKILDALNIVKMVSEPAVGTTTKIMVKKNRPSSQEGTLDTKLVEEMLMIMEDAGSKTAEKIRKSAMVDEMTAKQENAIVEDFIKMIEMGGEKATKQVKKTKNELKSEGLVNKFVKANVRGIVENSEGELVYRPVPVEFQELKMLNSTFLVVVKQSPTYGVEDDEFIGRIYTIDGEKYVGNYKKKGNRIETICKINNKYE